MATGYQKSNSNNVDVIVLLAAETAANTIALAPPVLSSTPTNVQHYDLTDYKAQVGPVPDKGHIVIYSTAGSGTMTLGATRVFLAHKGGSVAVSGSLVKSGPYGVGADATKGMLNNGASFGETGSDVLYHREEITGLSCADGIAVQLGAFGGTNPAYQVELHLPKYGPGVVS